MSKKLSLAVLAVIIGVSPAGGREIFTGPVAASVIKVIDGDTFEARARIWLGQDIVVRVRLDGIDTPELRARCDQEARLAAEAKSFMAERLRVAGSEGGRVALEDIHYGKYAGRVLAKVRLADGSDLGGVLIDAGLARAYDGGTRPDWCGDKIPAAG